MDTRTALQKNDRLHFPGMECVIEESAGRGSNVIAYIGQYADYQNPSLSHRVLIRELFPYDPQGGITRTADGRLSIDGSAQSLYDLGRESFLRGNQVHLQLLQRIPGEIDLHINTFEANDTLYSLLGYTGGRTLGEELEREERGSAFGKKAGSHSPVPEHSGLLHIIRIMKGALEALSSFHNEGYLHLDVSPDNILLIGEGTKERVALIDYNSVHTKEEIRSAGSVYYSTKEGYTAPEVSMGRKSQIGTCTDLYSMTAVFYRCLTGRRLSVAQAVGSSDPASAALEAPLIKGCPETVLSLICQILHRGLAITPRRRYRTVARMLADLTELEDRILGRGITHWALWEAGRERIRRALNNNTALEYIRDDKEIYPLYAETEDGSRVALLTELMPAQQTQPILLLGGGGMGKTTALLRIGYAQDKHYSAGSPALYYISLYGYRDGDRDHICDRLLESLKFKPHTDSMESARRELLRLMDRPVNANNTRPPFLLLLDGLNEARGDTAPLLEEIHRLAGLSGVQIILTSRSDPGDALFQKLTLCRLEQTEVRRILSEQGILPPENAEVLDLLSFPMMLSMYIRTVRDGGSQLRLESREELLEDYFDAILEKEKRDLPDDSPHYMGIRAAVCFLLPAIAAEAAKRQCALTDRELFQVVEKCYKELSGKAITAVRPEWTGHTAELRLGAGTADEWYGKAVLQVLWKRMGLLVRDEQNSFRIVHQMIGEHLAAQHAIFEERFTSEKKREKRKNVAVAAFILFTLITVFAFYNMHMVNELSQREQQLLEKNVESNISISENDLKDGNRYHAIEAALNALSPEIKNQQLINRGKRILANEVCAFQSPCFRVSTCIETPARIQAEAISEDGKYLVVVDDSKTMRCYDGRKGNELWHSQMDVFYEEQPTLEILPAINGILFCDERCLRFYSLQDGELIWKRNSCDDYVLTTENKLILALLDRPNNVGRFIWVEPSDGSLCKKGKLFEFDGWFGQGGQFLLDERPSYVAASISRMDDKSVLYRIDMESGELIEEIEVPITGKAEFENGNSTNVTTSCYLNEENAFGERGIFFCMSSIEKEKQSTLEAGFYSEKKREWMFFNTYTHYSRYSALNKAPVVIMLPDDQIEVLLSTASFVLDRNGNLQQTDSHESVVYCRCRELPCEYVVIYSDGTGEYLFEKDSERFTVAEQPINEGVGTGRSDYSRVEDNRNLANKDLGGIDKKGMHAFLCFVPASENKKIYVAEWLGDKNAVSSVKDDMNKKNKWGQDIGNNVYIMPDAESVLVLSPDDTVQTEDLEILMRGIIYNLETMKSVYLFSFMIPYTSTEIIGISKDCSVLVFQDCAYDICEKRRTDLNEKGQYQQLNMDILPCKEQYVVEKTGAVYKKYYDGSGNFEYEENWAKDTIDWFIHGEKHAVSLMYGDNNIVEHRAYYNTVLEGNEKRLSLADFRTGSSGLMAIQCTDDMENDLGYRNSTYYMLYSLEKDKWERINYPFSTDLQVTRAPYIEPANMQQWLAISGTDNVIWIYDALNSEYRQLTKDNVNYGAIRKMTFFAEDRYLIIWQDYSLSIVDTVDGRTVFYQFIDEEGKETLSGEFSYDETENTVYFYGNGGFCLNKEDWTVLYDMPHLASVTEKWIITQENGRIWRYPKYELQQLIDMGNGYVNQ